MRLVISLAVLMFIGCGTAPSEPKTTPRTGEYVCKRLGGAYKYRCLSLIKNKYIDQHAAGACDRYTTPEGTLECLLTISGKKFQDDALNACDRFNGEAYTTRCLRTIADCSFFAADVKECDRARDGDETIACFSYYCKR